MTFSRFVNKAFPRLVTLVVSGIKAVPNRPVVCSHAALARFAASSSALFSRQASAACVSPCLDNSCNTRFARSLSLFVASSFLLKSSSLVPAQFSTSANVPVTCPTLTVSLMASAKESMGMESPYVAHAPIAPSVSCVSCSCDNFNACRFAAAVAADWLSPNTP